MREIKFRAWDKNDKVMYGVRAMEFWQDIQEIHLRLMRYMEAGGIHPNVVRFPDEVELMQYTGLKDKNGVEIYEGDIVKSSEGTILVCQWSGYGFYEWWDYFAWEKGYYDAYLKTEDVTPLNKETTLEVIGNIYENKELLEVTND